MVGVVLDGVYIQLPLQSRYDGTMNALVTPHCQP